MAGPACNPREPPELSPRGKAPPAQPSFSSRTKTNISSPEKPSQPFQPREEEGGLESVSRAFYFLCQAPARRRGTPRPPRPGCRGLTCQEARSAHAGFSIHMPYFSLIYFYLLTYLFGCVGSLVVACRIVVP